MRFSESRFSKQTETNLIYFCHNFTKPKQNKKKTVQQCKKNLKDEQTIISSQELNNHLFNNNNLSEY